MDPKTAEATKSPTKPARRTPGIFRWAGPARGRKATNAGPVPKGRRPVLGLEISRGGLRFVEVANVGGHVKMLSHGEIAYGASEDLASVLKLLVAEYGVVARDVHVIDATSRANLRVQTMPEMPEKDLGQIVAGEIETESELADEALVGDSLVLHRQNGEMDVLVGKIPARERDTLHLACESAGFRLQVMTSSSVVLGQHLIRTGEVPKGEMVGLLDIGRSKMNMALVTRENLRLVREVYEGVSGRFLKEGVTDLDAIGDGLDEVVGTAAQIRRTLEQYRERDQASHLHHLVMTGETTRISRILGLLQHDLGVPVRTYDPSEPMGDARSEDYLAYASTYAVPWVLACTPAAEIPINFTPGVPDLRPVRTMQAVAGALAAAAIACFAFGVAEQGSLERTEARLTDLTAERTLLEGELGLLQDARVQWEEWVTSSAYERGLPGADLRPYLAELSGALPPDVRLLGAKLDRKPLEWHLTVDARAFSRSSTTVTHAAMERFVTAVTELPMVQDVELRPLKYGDHDRSQGDQLDLQLLLVLRPLEAATGPEGSGAPPPENQEAAR